MKPMQYNFKYFFSHFRRYFSLLYLEKANTTFQLSPLPIL